MIVKAIKTRKVVAGSINIFELLDESITRLSENSVVAVTSKVVAICEGRVVPAAKADKRQLIKDGSEFYLPTELDKYDFSFTITHGSLIPRAGIDESNGNGNLILWPKNPAHSANQIREYLRKRFKLNSLGVIITDSTVRPLHYGTEGIAISYSGFKPNKNYIGQPDIFGRTLKVTVNNIADALAASAVLLMGEGSEQTPFAIISDVPFIEFQDKNPTKKDLKSFFVPIVQDDLFAPFLGSVKWQKGGLNNSAGKIQSE